MEDLTHPPGLPFLQIDPLHSPQIAFLNEGDRSPLAAFDPIDGRVLEGGVLPAVCLVHTVSGSELVGGS